jgi:hypothetical protein
MSERANRSMLAWRSVPLAERLRIGWYEGEWPRAHISGEVWSSTCLAILSDNRDREAPQRNGRAVCAGWLIVKPWITAPIVSATSLKQIIKSYRWTSVDVTSA